MRRVSVHAALFWSIAGHAGAIAALAGWIVLRHDDRDGDREDRRRGLIDVSMASMAATDALGPSLPAARGDLAATVPGAADSWSANPASPFPRADLDAPDPLPAAHGGGGTGGAETYTDRHDRDDLRAQLWNDPESYRIPRRRTAIERTSSEWLARTKAPAIDVAARERTRQARDAARSDAHSATASWDDLDPRFEDGAHAQAEVAPDEQARTDRSASQLAEDGGIRTSAAQPFVKQGDEATEAAAKGPTRDNVDVAQAADEKHAEALELSRARGGGGAGDGVAGDDPGAGPSARSRRTDQGDGGTSADVPRKNGGRPSTRAADQDAYFKRLYTRVIDAVQFPPKLALELEQGNVVVAFTLHSDGTVADVKVVRSSGFREFDDAVLTAIRKVAPFDPLPRAAFGSRSSVKVAAPFTFDNPLIR